MSELVRRTKGEIGQDFGVSVKIRIHDDVRKTVDLCQRIEAAGADFITVHGRTVKQRSDPVNIEALRDIKSALKIPIVANGDIRSLEDVRQIREQTGVDGVMAARGILENPAMYAGFPETPAACVEDWVRIATETGTHFTCFHHHLIYMCERLLSRADRRVFNCLGSYSAVIDFFESKYGLSF